MATQRVSRAFKDISFSFEDPHPVTKDLPILKNERAIQKVPFVIWSKLTSLRGFLTQIWVHQ